MNGNRDICDLEFLAKGYRTWWESLWSERTRAVLSWLGETDPPGMVYPYSWKDPIIPGAFCMVFGPKPNRQHFIYLSLGVTQPGEPGQRTFPWEFCVRTTNSSIWPRQLLYDLMTYWYTEGKTVSNGLHLPLLFINAPHGQICAGLSEPKPDLNAFGAIRRLYLWEDMDHHEFSVTSGNFRLLTAIGITEDEDKLGLETTPPHLLLLLREMGIGQMTEPHRESVMRLKGAERAWSRIQKLSHAEAFRKLNASR